MNAAPFTSVAAVTGTGEFLLRYPELAAACIAAAKSTVIVVAALLVSSLFRHRSAVARCWILRLASPALLLAALWPLAAHRIPMAFVRFEVAVPHSVPSAGRAAPVSPLESSGDAETASNHEAVAVRAETLSGKEGAMEERQRTSVVEVSAPAGQASSSEPNGWKFLRLLGKIGRAHV